MRISARFRALVLFTSLLASSGLWAGCDDDDYSADAKLSDMAVKG